MFFKCGAVSYSDARIIKERGRDEHQDECMTISLSPITCAEWGNSGYDLGGLTVPIPFAFFHPPPVAGLVITRALGDKIGVAW